MKIQRLKDGRLRDAGTGLVLKDRNPIDENLSMVQTIVNRMERQGDTYYFGPLAENLMQSSLKLKKLVAQKKKNEALQEFSKNVRILRKIQGTPTISKPLQMKAKELLGKASVIEKEIRGMNDSSPELTDRSIGSADFRLGEVFFDSNLQENNGVYSGTYAVGWGGNTAAKGKIPSKDNPEEFKKEIEKLLKKYGYTGPRPNFRF